MNLSCNHSNEFKYSKWQNISSVFQACYLGTMNLFFYVNILLMHYEINIHIILMSLSHTVHHFYEDGNIYKNTDVEEFFCLTDD